jgi:tetratricopeptide (TPR) repeat protein
VTDGVRVYVGGHDHRIYALVAATGVTIWRRETARRIEGRPLLLDDVLYVAGHDHYLRALDAATGLELWHAELPRRVQGGPAASAHLVLAADRSGNVVAVERVLTAEVYASQERWAQAAAAYARRGNLAAAAEIYEEQLDEPFYSAELWQAIDRPDRAAPLYRQVGAEDKARAAYGQAAQRAAADGDHFQAGEGYAAVEAWTAAGEQYEQASRPDLAAPAFAKAGLTARAAAFYEQMGDWPEAARLYEQAEAWSQAVECHERAGNWERAGHLYQQLGNFEAAASAFIQAAHALQKTAPQEKARLAELWAAAEVCCREVFDQVQAEACRRQVAYYRGLPYIEAEIVPPERTVTGRYNSLKFVLHNVGGGEAEQIIVHHTRSEFMGELSESREIRGLSPGQHLEQFLSVRPLASGPVPLVVAIDYSDEAGNLYQTTYRTRVTVLEPDEPALASPEPSAMETDYADFDLLIGQPSGDVYPVHVVNSPAGGATGDFRLPFTPEELAVTLQELEDDQADEERTQDFGARLFTALFQGQVGSRFRSSQGMVAQGKGLRLRLRIGAGGLVTLPWELLYDPEPREFLSLTRRNPVVRHLRVPRPTVARPVAPPLQMLVVPASPKDLMPLDVQAEVEALLRAVQPLVEGGLLAVDVLKPPTVQALREYLIDYPCHILHFIGHGGFDGREGYLALEDAQRRMERLDARELKVLFSNTPVRLAVLNACLTARDAAHPSPSVPERAYLGVAPALVDAGLLAVVASQFSLSDVGARLFAQDFYRMLARGRPVDEAVDQARVAMMLELGLACRDWAAPVLFLRGSSGELFP